MFKKICLASDNCTSAHPLIIQAMIESNEGYSAPYGADPWTEEAQKLIQQVFKKKCKVFIVQTGTGANVFGLKLGCRNHQSIICTDIAHINTQETGSAEAIIGSKLLTVPHQNGKITVDGALNKLKRERSFGKHTTSPRVLSITQPTEVGTIYSVEDLKSLSKLCKEENLLFHIDGCRIYNAAVSLKISLDEMFKGVEIDMLSLGGTKNGLISAEAVVIFNPDLEEGSDHMQKQTLQLLSKMRYVSAQYLPFFKNNLWHTLASHANLMAQEIAMLIKATPGLSLHYPVETNQVFFSAPSPWIPLIQEKIFCNVWDEEKNEIRFIASWNTSKQDIEELKTILTKLS